MRTMYDAAYPPATPPPTDIVAFYIGGDTPHTWSDTEIARQTARWRLPIWVRSNPDQADPSIDAERTVAWLDAHQVPRGVVVALDLETAVNPRYVATYSVAVLRAGYLVMKYGSEATIFRNPSTPGGTWVADYNGDAIIDLGAAADQFAANVPPGVDLSSVADSVPLWDTRPPPPPLPAPPLPLEDFVQPVIFGWINPTTGVESAFVTDGWHYREIHDPTEEGGLLGVLAMTTGHKPIFYGGPSLPPVAVIREWGLPADAETARIAGVPFP